MGSIFYFFIFWCFSISFASGDTPADPHPTVTFFNVGQGDLTVLRSHQSCLVIDAGGEKTWGSKLVQHLKQSCQQGNTLILTHFDQDHILNVPLITKSLPFKAVYTNPSKPKSQTAKRIFRNLQNKYKDKVKILGRGDTFKFYEFNVRVLWPPLQSEKLKFENLKSIVLEVKAAEKTLLLTGDIPSKAETLLIPRKIDILKVAHHGSRSSSSAEFLKQFHPKTCVISHGLFSRYGHPHKEAVLRLREAHCAVLSTAQNKSIEMEL